MAGSKDARPRTGKVYLVGAGPGDPGLLTRKGARLLRRADVVIHDALVGEAVLDLIGPEARRIDVGKRYGGRGTRQRRINELLVECARESRVVVRLKGGDPFVFGRGGEEALALAAAGVRFEVVPGVTAASGVAAYAGIPLTHRELASSVTLVTGHHGNDDERGVDWGAIARLGGTVVIYMGVSTLDATVARLIEGGRAGDTPAAVIEWGTHARQRTVTASLTEIVAAARTEGIGAPALVVIGDVASLAPQLSWFERGALRGRRVLVARTRAQPSRIAAALKVRGADVVEYPRLGSERAGDPGEIARSVDGVASSEWLIFSSPAAVGYFWKLLAERGLDARALGGVRIAALGAATGRALRHRSIVGDIETRTFMPAAVVRRMAEVADLAGARVLFPREVDGESPVAMALREAGAIVDELGIFRVLPDLHFDGVAGSPLLDADAIVLPSSSAARLVAEAMRSGDAGVVPTARFVAIGPRTAEAALGMGLPIHAIAGDHSVQGVVGAVTQLLAPHRENRESPVEPTLAGGGTPRHAE